MNGITTLGLVAGLLTTIAYVPQLLKVWRTKSADDISWSMLITLCAGIILWLIYASVLHDVALIAANVVTFILSSAILILKIRYSRPLPDVEGDRSASSLEYGSSQISEDMPLGSPELTD